MLGVKGKYKVGKDWESWSEKKQLDQQFLVSSKDQTKKWEKVQCLKLVIENKPSVKTRKMEWMRWMSRDRMNGILFRCRKEGENVRWASEAKEGRKGRKSNLHLNVHFFKQRFVTAIWAENFLQHERSFLTIAAAAETFSSLGWVSKVASKPGLLAVSYYDAWVRIAYFCSNTQTGDTCFLTFFFKWAFPGLFLDLFFLFLGTLLAYNW